MHIYFSIDLYLWIKRYLALNKGTYKDITNCISFQKEEKLDNFHDATVLELSEELDVNGGRISVYSIPENYNQSLGHSQTEEEEEIDIGYVVDLPKTKVVMDVLESDMADKNTEVQGKQINSNMVQLDRSKRYGSYVTKMLRLIHSKEKQLLLIKELNHAVQEFFIENR